MKLSEIIDAAGKNWAKKHIPTAHAHLFSFNQQSNANAFASWAARNHLHYIISFKHAWVCIKMKGVTIDA